MSGWLGLGLTSGDWWAILIGAGVGVVGFIVRGWVAVTCPACGARHRGAYIYSGIGVSTRSHGRPYGYLGIGRRWR